MSATRRNWITAALIGLVVALSGCNGKTDETVSSTGTEENVVVVYTALDRQFSEPILRDFTDATGIETKAVYDTESTKTVGLVNRIRAEANRPRCDVFWNNEILNTLRLKAEGLLQSCDPPEAKAYPARYRDAEGYWFGFAARARVIIVNTELVNTDAIPTSIRDLANPRWRGRTGIAKPLFGTTASHVACLFAVLGDDQARELLLSYRANEARVVAGNKTCAEMVASGQLAFGLTDTDDAVIELESGKPIRIVFPDGGDDGMGTLLLPNTLAIVRGAPHPQAALRLIDYLLTAEVEARLAEGPSAQIPLHAGTTTHSRVCRLSSVKQMNIDFAHAAEAFPNAAAFVEEHFLR